jgi:FKBP-type peptidyl-prolyl cis-trans isomerase
MKKSWSYVVLMVLVVALNACGEKWVKLPGGVQYRILKNGDPKVKISEGSYIGIYLMNKTENDSLVFDGHKKGQPQKLLVQTAGNADGIMTGLKQLHKGDSVLFILPSDSFFRDERSRPPYIKKGSMLKIYMAIVEVDSKEAYEQARQEALRRQQEELEPMNDNQAAPSASDEDKMIQKYLAEKHLTNAVKTASGLYYVITQNGYGDKIKKGQTAVMNYTGRLLNDTPFDSNTDPQFQHTQPFEFSAGIGQVIPGWNEGVLLLNKGAKAKWIIPSALAYGEQSRPPVIRPHSILVFDVELANIK